MPDPEEEKRAAGAAAAELVESGMLVGLGTGSTVGCLLPALAARKLDIRCVVPSPQTEARARELGIPVEPFDNLDRLDIAIDGADQVDPAGWLIKGGGAAHTREKIVARASRRFVVIVSAEKLVRELTPPIPLELVRFGLHQTLRELQPARVRDGVPLSPDGGVIADYLGPVGEPHELAARLSAAPGVVEHGLFCPELVSEILVAGEHGVERRAGG